MSDKPIIFSAPMIRALLDGRKTQTRRVLKGLWQNALEGHDRVKTWFAPTDVPKHGIPNQWAESGIWAEKHGPRGYNRFLGFSPYRPGDRLWVREAWSGEHEFRNTPPAQRESYAWEGQPHFRETAWYWADGSPEHGDWEKPRPSIHMPRWASRLTLTVTGVRVQRVQDISEADVYAEGAMQRPAGPRLGSDVTARDNARLAFRSLWNSIHGPGAWDANPWVCALSFTVHQQNIDAVESYT